MQVNGNGEVLVIMALALGFMQPLIVKFKGNNLARWIK